MTKHVLCVGDVLSVSAYGKVRIERIEGSTVSVSVGDAAEIEAPKVGSGLGFFSSLIHRFPCGFGGG